MDFKFSLWTTSIFIYVLHRPALARRVRAISPIANNFVLKIGRGEAEGRGGGTPAARDGGDESVGGVADCAGTESRAFPDTGNRAAGSREEGGRREATS